MNGKVVIIDDDQFFCKTMKMLLQDYYDVLSFCNPLDALSHLKQEYVDVVLTDLYMPEINGIDLLKRIKSELFDVDVIVMTAYAGIDTAIEAIKLGAFDYLVKPFRPEELLNRLKNIFKQRRLAEENIELKDAIHRSFSPENIVGKSDAMKRVYSMIERVSKVDSTVLITGESGTGKELVARAIHFNSERKNRKFVSINCTAIPDSLLESELFGFEKGAFSGAYKKKKGLFEYANGGTILLDEIGDASLQIQSKLLRVLQEHKIRPVGSNEEITVDVRVICSTNKDLPSLIKQNKFREDLYYRINVVHIKLPPLRERKSDIPMLIAHFLEGRKKIHPRVVDILTNYHWPGNVRELQNLIERLVTLTDKEIIEPEDLPPEILKIPVMMSNDSVTYSEAKKRLIDEFNINIITSTLVKYSGNVTRAAEHLGLDRANFQRLMRRYNITSKDFKQSSTNK